MHLRSFPGLVALSALVVLGSFALAGDRSLGLVVWACAYLLWAAGAALLRARSAAARARAHHDAETGARELPLREGPCVLAGTVAYARDRTEAMRVEFTQLGSENESSGSWSHKWTEIHRKLTVQPFYVVRDDCERVRIEPTAERSRLYDELENKILVREDLPGVPAGSGPQRARFATLVPEEHVWVTGRLERGFDPENPGGTASQTGYRESAQPSSWVMRGDPTLIVSSVSLAGHFRDRCRRHASHAVFLLLCLVGPLAMLWQYVDRLQGETVTGTVSSVRTMTDDDDRVTGYVATVRHARGYSESETLANPPTVGTSTLTFRVGAYSDNAGAVARFSENEMVLCFVLCLLALAARCGSTIVLTTSLPWYRSDKMKVEDSGSGRL